MVWNEAGNVGATHRVALLQGQVGARRAVPPQTYNTDKEI